MADDELVLDVPTPLGFRVRLGKSYWRIIATIKHPVMADRLADVERTLQSPDEVRRSRRDESVFLFYTRIASSRWTCVVTRRLNGKGFVITTYPTDAIKEGMTVWTR